MASILLLEGRTATSVNLSGSGIYFQSDQAFSVGEEVALVLPFNYAKPGLTRVTRVTCEARIVRVDRRGPGFGVAAAYEPVAFELDEVKAQRPVLHPDA